MKHSYFLFISRSDRYR